MKLSNFWKKGRWLSAAALMGAVVVAAVTPALAVHDLGLFELDKNAVNDATAGDDWANVLLGNGGGSLKNTGVIVDPANTTIFTGGGSKDDINIPSWQHTGGSVPDKDEITNAYAAAYTVTTTGNGAQAGDLVLYYGADRFAQNGSSNNGFWFFKNNVAPKADGTFTGTHAVGDILIVSEFTNGGAVSTVKAYEWVGSGGGSDFSSSGTVKPLASGGDCASTSNDSLCAVVNSGNIAAPWPYTPKQGASGTIPKGGFFEGGINLSAVFRAANSGSVGCFSSFLAETRSSPSGDAVLKDFVAGQFPLCDANIKIANSAVNAVGVNHIFDITGTVTALGGASATFTSITPTVTPPAGLVKGADYTEVSTCATPTVNGNVATCSVTINSNKAGVFTANATMVATVGGDQLTRSTDGVSPNSGPATKRFVDAKISLSPLTDTNGITELHTITATVQQDDGLAANAAGGDATTGFGPAANGTVVTFSLTNLGAATSAFVPAGQNTCQTAGGTCTVQITSPTAGTVNTHATTSVTVSGQQMTRSTGPNVAQTAGDDVEKIFVDGTLRWLKVDNLNNPLGGATFQVCRTHNFNSATSGFDDITDVCVSVTDNSAPDTDSDAGELQMAHLILGRYTIKETAAPSGYSLDPDTETVELTLANPSNVSNPPTFVNPFLFTMFIITCNQATHLPVNGQIASLAPSSGHVALPGAPQDTLGLPQTADNAVLDLCAKATGTNVVGSAEYYNLTDSTFDLSADVKK